MFIKLKSEKNKSSRAQQLNGRHTTGSRSNAVVLDQLVFLDCRTILLLTFILNIVPKGEEWKEDWPRSVSRWKVCKEKTQQLIIPGRHSYKGSKKLASFRIEDLNITT